MIRYKPPQGFTLIEVMVALAVVAIGLTAVLKVINEEIIGTAMVQNKRLALWMLTNKIAEIRLNPSVAPIGVNQGQQVLFNQTWYWQVNTQATANSHIRKVAISIFAPNSASQESLLSESVYLSESK